MLRIKKLKNTGQASVVEVQGRSLLLLPLHKKGQTPSESAPKRLIHALQYFFFIFFKKSVVETSE